MKRIAIFLAYDAQGIIDRYIQYLLKELKNCVDTLAVVYNGMEIKSGKELLHESADMLFFRENEGLDAGGFKDAMCNFIGWSELEKYDELVLVNDSFFGPFKPMKEIFSEMDKKECDFWGLTKHAEAMIQNKYIPEHIQSYFIVVRERMLHSNDFKEYWETMPYYKGYQEVVDNHEIMFTQLFYNKGYSYQTLANTEKNDSVNIKENYNQYLYIPYQLVKGCNYPFVKRKAFSLARSSVEICEECRKLLDYVESCTDYDVALIWESIMRMKDVWIENEELVTVEEKIASFCRDNKKVYVYGIGYFTSKYKHLISGIEAYIVSDGKEKPEAWEGIPVRYLSELSGVEDIAIIVCLSETYLREVIPLLEEKGFNNYMHI